MILSHFDPCTMLPSGNIILSDRASTEKKKRYVSPLSPLRLLWRLRTERGRTVVYLGDDGAPVCGPERINDAAAINKGRYKLD